MCQTYVKLVVRLMPARKALISSASKPICTRCNDRDEPRKMVKQVDLPSLPSMVSEECKEEV